MPGATGGSVTARSQIPPREVKIYRLDEPVRCPSGHAYSETAGIMPHAWLRCTKRVPGPEGAIRRCDEFVYVVNFGNGLLGVSPVDWREAHHMQKLQMDIAAVAEFLQLPWKVEV